MTSTTGARPLRVAVDVTALLDPTTGVGSLVRAVVSGLGSRSGVEVRGYALTWRGRDRLAEVAPGLVMGRSLPARPCRAWWSRWDRPGIELATGAVDVVHGPNFVVPPARRAAELVTVHDLTAWHQPELVHPTSLAYPRLLARAVARGAHVHVVSRFVADEVVGLTGLAGDRVHVIPNGVSPLPPGTAEGGRRLAGVEEYLLAVGTVEPRKDYPGLVEALAQLVAQRPQLHLVIAGGEGWGRDQLDQAVERWRLAGRVRRLGYVSDADKAHLLAGARLLVYPSRYEGFGLVPLEAMAAGVPVVATRGGAVPEVVGDAAELCPVGDPEALAASLRRVLDDDDRAHALVEAGRRRVSQFSWDSAVDDLVRLYTHLARPGAVGPGR